MFTALARGQRRVDVHSDGERAIGIGFVGGPGGLLEGELGTDGLGFRRALSLPSVPGSAVSGVGVTFCSGADSWPCDSGVGVLDLRCRGRGLLRVCSCSWLWASAPSSSMMVMVVLAGAPSV